MLQGILMVGLFVCSFFLLRLIVGKERYDALSSGAKTGWTWVIAICTLLWGICVILLIGTDGDLSGDTNLAIGVSIAWPCILFVAALGFLLSDILARRKAAQFESTLAAEPVVCPACGKTIRGTFSHCPACGRLHQDPQPQGNSNAATTPSPSPRATVKPAAAVPSVSDSSGSPAVQVSASPDATPKLKDGYIICPKCSTVQRANRTCCYECGIKFPSASSQL